MRIAGGTAKIFRVLSNCFQFFYKKFKMLRAIYSLILYLIIPFILLRLLWRGCKMRDYWQRWHERFGFTTLPPGCLWIHAVSVGEFQAAIPLIQQIKYRHPHLAILVTTMTVTGSQRVQAVFGDQVHHAYLPYDLPDAVARFLQRVQPSLLILMETELWFNLLHHCQQRHIPVILANARLSEPSARGYHKIAMITRKMFNAINEIAAQTAQDAQRFIDLGMKPAKVHLIGNIKFDARLPEDLAIRAQQLRQSFGTRPIWIAASTHDEEEVQVLAAFAEIIRQLPETLLILVPRHPERFVKVANLCEKSGYSVVKRSEATPCSAATQIYLGDTMGELILLYAVSDVAFIGGSLVAVGGHNMLEAAAVGVPVIFGTQIFNFAEIGQNLLAINAAHQITNAAELAAIVVDYLSYPELRNQVGQRGLQFVQQNQGALARLIQLMTPYLNRN